MRQLVCRSIRTTLAARVLDTGRVPDWMEGHVVGCLRCQAVVAQSRRLRRTLATLGPGEPVDEGSRGSRRLMAAGFASIAAAVVVARARSQRG